MAVKNSAFVGDSLVSQGPLQSLQSAMWAVAPWQLIVGGEFEIRSLDWPRKKNKNKNKRTIADSGVRRGGRKKKNHVHRTLGRQTLLFT